MNKIKLISSLTEFQNYRHQLKASTTVGFVPTMGALHQGHASLIKNSSQNNELTVVSIFVNPTQFNNSTDLEKYPRTLEADLKLAEDSGAHIVLAPHFEEMYPDQYRYKITENEFSKKLCGAHRPGHFDGVLTVVMKLLQIVKPKIAYFGEKDYQQLLLIQQMAQAFFLDLEVKSCETIREADGLAMSSRNVRLTPEGRKIAPAIFQALKNYKNFSDSQSELKKLNIELEYLEEHFQRRFIAAYIDGVRLIDNVAI